MAKAKDPSCAAIVHASAAKIYGLTVLANGIQDHKENFTRFMILSKESAKGDRCTLVFTLEHRPGSLARVLAGIAEREVNLTFLLSRPLIGKPFEYLFTSSSNTPATLFLNT